jgi:hypothetical protein
MEASGQLHITATLTLRKEPPIPIVYEAAGPQIQSGGCGEEKNLAHAGN